VISSSRFGVLATLALFAIASLADAPPAGAQWTRVDAIPSTTIFNVFVSGDTIAASADTAVYVSTDAGAAWKTSARVAPGVTDIERIRIHNGRLFAGARGQGVFVSDDLGETWSDFNQGLVGGFANSQLVVIDMMVVGDSLYVATDGAGVWVRNLTSGTWGPFGNAFEANEANNMTAIAAGNGRLFGAGGFNGTVFYRDPGQSDWTLSLLFNDRFAAGLAALTALWTGSHWVVGANNGVYVSAHGQEPWTFSNPGAGNPLFTVSFAQHGHDLFANFGAFASRICMSTDDGITWRTIETLPVPVPSLAILGDTLYAARTDGLWRRSIAGLSEPPRPSSGLSFAIEGAQPVRDLTRFRFDLPEAGHAVVEVFDVAGRRSSKVLDAVMPAGPGEIDWRAGALASGVYLVRMRVGDRSEVRRLIRVR
jgi:hypothetical protein